MKNLKELVENCQFNTLDKKEAHEYSKEEKKVIRALSDEIPNIDLEENWVDLYFQYFEKLSHQIYTYNHNQQYRPDEYFCSGYYEVNSPLRTLLSYCVKNSPSKIDAIRQLKARSLQFIQTNEPKSMLLHWLTDIYCEDGRNLINIWKLNKAEEEEIFLLLQAIQDELQKVLLSGTFKHKDSFKLYYATGDLGDALKTYLKLYPENEHLQEMNHQVNFLKLIGQYDKAYLGNFQDTFEKICKKDNSIIPIPIPAQDELLDYALDHFKTNRKTSYTFLLIRHLLHALNILTKNKVQFNRNVNQGGALGNVIGFVPFEAALSTLSYNSEDINTITDYLSSHFQNKIEKHILKTTINDKYYNLIKSDEEKAMFIKVLVKKSCDLNSSDESDIELTRLLVGWDMVEKNAIPEEYQIIAPNALPQSAEDLEKLVDQLKLKSKHFSFNRKAKEEEIPDSWSDHIKEIYLWKNGSKEYEFAPISEQGEAESNIDDTYENHLDEEDEVEDNDFKWPEVDIRKHIDNNIIGIGKIGNGDFYFIDPTFLSIEGKAIVFSNCHDSLLTAKAEANSLAEFIGKLMIERCIKINGPDEKLEALLNTKVLAQTK